MNDFYIKLSIAALLPVIATVFLYSMGKSSRFEKLNY